MKRLIITLICICAAGMVFAQTPVEKVIIKYAESRGSKDFIASGGEMVLARSLIRKTPLAAIAPDVDTLEVLKMQNASETIINAFEKDLKEALDSYDYYGEAQGKNGIVDIYITKSGKDTIDELVIYNPKIHSVNSLKGEMSMSQLIRISEADKQK